MQRKGETEKSEGSEGTLFCPSTPWCCEAAQSTSTFLQLWDHLPPKNSTMLGTRFIPAYHLFYTVPHVVLNRWLWCCQMQRDTHKCADCIVFMDQGSCISFSKGTFFSIPFCIKHIVHFCYQIVSTVPLSLGFLFPWSCSSLQMLAFLLYSLLLLGNLKSWLCIYISEGCLVCFIIGE